MTPRRALLLIRQGPSCGSGAGLRERLEIALMGLALDQSVSLAFIDEGVRQLLPAADHNPGDSLLKVLRSLPLYDISGIYLERESLSSEELPQVDAIAEIIPRAQLLDLIAKQDLLL